MSVITSVIVVTGSLEDEALAAVNAWLAGNDPRGQQLAEISTNGSGGYRMPCVHLWAAGFNMLDTFGFIDALRAAPWRIPQDVIAYVDDEAAGTFAVSPAVPGEWRPAQPEAGTVTEYAVRANDGGYSVWPPDNPDYPAARRIGHERRAGRTVLRRRVIVAEDWTEAIGP